MYRGVDFRPDYRSVARLRSIFSAASCLGLSATVTAKVLDDVLAVLQLRRVDVHLDSVLPDRPNIFLEVSPLVAN